MSSKSFPVIGANMMRGTRLDACGRPVYGDKSQIASEGFVSIAVTANYDDGTEKQVTNAGGKKCINVPPKPEFLNYSIDLTFCNVDPDFYTLATGFPAIVDPVTGDTIGYKTNRSVRPMDVGWALEAWSSAVGSVACDISGDVPWGYSLWPFLSGARAGDYTLEDNAVTFTVSAAITRDGTGWGVGPYNVVRDAAGALSPLLEVLDILDHDLRQYTTVPPPEETGGLIPLDDPDGSAATQATAGIPGTWNGTRPADLAALQASAITASPSTDWTTGQFVYLGDGSRATWDGAAWVAGVAN